MQPFSIVPLIALFLGAVAGATSAAASEAPPVAMVMRIAGPTEPKLPLRAQLGEGAKVKIPPSSRLTFVLFGKCGLYTATGGTASFGRQGASIEGGTIERTAGPCGKVHMLAPGEGPMAGGGANLRSAVNVEHVGPRPSFAVGGDGAARVTGAHLVADDSSDDRSSIEMMLKDGSLSLPADVPSLRARRYVLSLKVSYGPAPPTLPVVVSADSNEGRLDVLYLK